MTTLEQIEELRHKLNEYNRLYYVDNNPVVSDKEFDEMMYKLQELEKEHPEFFDPNSPTQRVGSDLTSRFEAVHHRYPMMSLSNTYSLEELHEFYERVVREAGETEFTCELKFDGTAISLTYEKGRLIRAVTRGDGTMGDDVTSNVRTIRSIPLVLAGNDWPQTFEMRGEIYMPRAVFAMLNREKEEIGEQPFANPRNAAAGTLKLQNSATVASRHLDCFLYAMLGNDLPYKSHWENLNKAREWGFRISEHMQLCHTWEEITDFINNADKLRKELPYDTDGAVVKVNNYDIQQSLGSTAKAPRWAVAYKFQAERALTCMRSVEFSVGRTGTVTPVANLDPVQLAGTTVKRATLHNADQIALLDLRLGDMVYVEKGGEIIPKITGVETSMRHADSKPFEFTTKCPQCGATLVRYEGEAAWYCPNSTACPPQIIGRIVHFISRKAMDIEGLGEETVSLFYEQGLLHDIADLYDLNPTIIAALPRLGDKSASNIMESLKRSRNVPFPRVLYALGIRFVGETTAKNIAQHFKTIDAIMAASESELAQAEDVGDKIASSIKEYFADPANLDIITRLRKAGLHFETAEKEKLSDALTGKSIVISGSFEHHSRDELKALIELHGGRNLAAISGNVDYLLAGVKMGPAKLAKATKLGIKIISENEFEKMIANDTIQSSSTDTSGQTEMEQSDQPIVQQSLF